tara:strand:+ start:740 stop:1015 length:276 start_codon:yes stop_codon:yes gene_type:complete
MSMKMLHNNVLIAEKDEGVDNVTAGGIILTADIDKAIKPGVVISCSLAVANAFPELSSGSEVYLDWKEAMAITVQGKKGAIVDVQHIRAIV